MGNFYPKNVFPSTISSNLISFFKEKIILGWKISPNSGIYLTKDKKVNQELERIFIFEKIKKVIHCTWSGLMSVWFIIIPINIQLLVAWCTTKRLSLQMYSMHYASLIIYLFNDVEQIMRQIAVNLWQCVTFWLLVLKRRTRKLGQAWRGQCTTEEVWWLWGYRPCIRIRRSFSANGTVKGLLHN